MQLSFKYYLLGIIFGLWCSQYCLAQQARAEHTNWDLASQTKNVAIYKRNTTSGYIEVRGVTRVHNTPEAFVALLEQTHLAPKWIANIQEVKILATHHNTRVVHSKFNAPWPIKNRDMVTKSTTYYQQGVLYIDVVDMGMQYPEIADFVRIHDITGQWTLFLTKKGSTRIEYRGQANPGGNIPIWLANRTLVSSMSETFENIVLQLDNPSLSPPN